ncbi:alpha/beta fold hydrolase [Nonomuraea sp. NPDC049309]|uniref:alpha/beta fold hydrolase n=1 Tax=Nonomuraea sp. NPDC049309 TaxID=3364350 RepID=UPI003721BC5D
MARATLHDGRTIEVEVHGSGPAVLLPVDPHPVEGEQAEEMRKWGNDPALGRNLIDGLAGDFQVVAFDYQGHVMEHPKPDTLTPENVARDFLAVADAAGAERFAYYGYSWLALSGLQLAVRTDRLSALAMGGFPPYGGPYAEMLKVTTATYELATAPKAEPAAADDDDPWSSAAGLPSEEQARQFVTLYENLQDFDDTKVRLACPRLCFAGSSDQIRYDQKWGGVTVDIGGPLVRHRAELAERGWDVEVLDGHDHMTAMQPAAVLPVLRPWLSRVLTG